eukprot:6207004-Pleurochrysis_carterae.AAC.1
MGEVRVGRKEVFQRLEDVDLGEALHLREVALRPGVCRPYVGHGTHALLELVVEVDEVHVLAMELLHPRLHGAQLVMHQLPSGRRALDVISALLDARRCCDKEQRHLAVVPCRYHVQLVPANRELFDVGRVLPLTLSPCLAGLRGLALDLIHHLRSRPPLP